MQRHNPRRSSARQTVGEALPERPLTADWYWGCYRRWMLEVPGWEWPDGSLEIAASIDQAVADLVDKHRIVSAERRRSCTAYPGLWGLREWLEDVVVGYFDLQDMIGSEITGHQAVTYKRRVARLSEALRKELERLYGVGSAMRNDITAIEQIAARAQRHEVLGDRPTKRGNASKDALHVLSRRICLFWLPCDDWRRAESCDPSLDLSVGSSCFRFAKYVYTYLGAPRCTDRMIVKRLRAAAMEIITGQPHEHRRFYTFPAHG